MTTYEMTRCKKCSYLIEDEDGNWICGCEHEDIHDISDEDCPVNNEY